MVKQTVVEDLVSTRDCVPVLVDAHVHIYDCFNLSELFSKAFGNFSQAASRLGLGKKFIPVLILTESAGCRWFERLLELKESEHKIEGRRKHFWYLRSTNEAFSLYAQSSDGESLVIVAGRQIVTAESLEVLALCTPDMFPDGMQMEEVICAVHQSNAIPVVPWGFGKWWGRRGRTVSSFLRSPRCKGVFLGDNGGRSAILPYPKQFRTANKIGLRILPGSDPLPIPMEESRAGTSGFMITESMSLKTPGSDLRRALGRPHVEIKPFMSLDSPYRFLRNQLFMQARKHLRIG
jgi:hypothetical protein